MVSPLYVLSGDVGADNDPVGTEGARHALRGNFADNESNACHVTAFTAIHGSLGRQSNVS